MKFPLELLQQCWFLTGPTASGKSALGVELARKIDAEIISLDSMAIYRGMDIGTAKPSLHERQQVPHHLIDIVEPHEEFSTASYLQAALQSCEEIVGRGRTPLFVGGTGLYLRAVLRGVFEGPPADWEFRRAIESEAGTHPAGWLWTRLDQVDPQTALRLHPNDTRRLVRALEIHHLTGAPPSELQLEQPLPPEVRPQRVFWLHPPRKWLHDRIDRRVEQMFEAGLETEVRHLLEREPPLGRTARQALGYREVIDWLEGRIETREECCRIIQARTRQFAKRQYTWFRNLEECREIPIAGTESVQELRDVMLNAGLCGD